LLRVEQPNPGVPRELEYNPYLRRVSVDAPATLLDDELDFVAPGRTGHGNRTGARRQAALNPVTDTRPAAIALAAKERRAIKLRASGSTFQQIAEELGYRSRAAARSATVRGLQRWMASADDFRAQELDRADMLGRESWWRCSRATTRTSS
jgi:hypothetical protein